MFVIFLWLLHKTLINIQLLYYIKYEQKLSNLIKQTKNFFSFLVFLYDFSSKSTKKMFDHKKNQNNWLS